MTDELTLEGLAARAGEPVEILLEWREIGLLGTAEQFDAADAERVRLVRFLLERGFSLDLIARAEANQDGLLGRFLTLQFPTGRVPTYATGELIDRVGLDRDLVRRLWEAAGLAEFGESASDEDVEALRALAIALDAGLPEAAVLQLLRVYSDSLRRVAEAEIRLFHFYVHERLRADGVAEPELAELSEVASAQLESLVEPAILYFHRKGWVSAVRDDLALHVAQEAGLSKLSDVPGKLSVAVVFADLSRFTPLTEVMGDVVAAEIVDRFSAIVRTVVVPRGGKVVKQIGDAFMVVFFEPRSAVASALEIEERVANESQFPAVRLGAHWGEVLYREGDYVGSTVNIAARLAAEAGPHELLVSSALRQHVETLSEIEFVPLGMRVLKGLADEVELHAIRRVVVAPHERFVDPVCGMELRPAEVAARLDVAGKLRGFCSGACLQLYVAAPERYAI